jgi:hypothetical protein
LRSCIYIQYINTYCIHIYIYIHIHIFKYIYISQNGTARTGQAEQDKQNRRGRIWNRQIWTGKTGQAEKDKQKRTSRPGQAELESRTGKAEQDWQNWTGRTGLLGRAVPNTASYIRG